MRIPYLPLAPAVCLAVLTGCGTTHRFVDELPISVSEPSEGPREAAAALFGQTGPYTVSLCQADRVSKACRKGNPGITASGVGGLLLPLSLHVTAIVVKSERPSSDGWDIDASVTSRVDAIPPLCRTVHGKILARANDTLSVELHSFYCNWMAVGNVLVNADLSIDSIDLKRRSFTGFYRISFHGTGNAAGSGYYRAAILPRT